MILNNESEVQAVRGDWL